MSGLSCVTWTGASYADGKARASQDPSIDGYMTADLIDIPGQGRVGLSSDRGVDRHETIREGIPRTHRFIRVGTLEAILTSGHRYARRERVDASRLCGGIADAAARAK